MQTLSIFLNMDITIVNKVLSAIHKKICPSLLMNDTGSVDMVKPNVKKHGNSDIKC
jgi:hypothetical protein